MLRNGSHHPCPPGRQSHAMATLMQNSTNATVYPHQVLLFGGWSHRSFSNQAQVLNDTWVFELDAANIAAAGAPRWRRDDSMFAPPGRHDHSLAPLGDGRGTLLFGGVGSDGALLGDTWIYHPTSPTVLDRNASNWTRVVQGSDPVKRRLHAAAYLRDGAVVVYGGVQGVKTLDDVWVYDALGSAAPAGGKWSELTMNSEMKAMMAAARQGHSMATLTGETAGSGSLLHHVLVFGGASATDGGQSVQTKAYVLSVTSSSPADDSGTSVGSEEVTKYTAPEPRRGAAMAAGVLFGGTSDDGIKLDDTWRFDTTQLSQFGSWDLGNYNNTSPWYQRPHLTDERPPGRSNHAMSTLTDVGPQHWSSWSSGSNPIAVMFGGAQAADRMDQLTRTWVYIHNLGFQELNCTGAGASLPKPRLWHNLAFVSSSSSSSSSSSPAASSSASALFHWSSFVLMFGGNKEDTHSNAETWRLHTTWTQDASGTLKIGPTGQWKRLEFKAGRPEARAGHAMASMGRKTRKVVMFSGCHVAYKDCSGKLLEDTWVFDGANSTTPRWTLVVNSTSFNVANKSAPLPRVHAAMAPLPAMARDDGSLGADRERIKVILFGGCSTPDCDAWQLLGDTWLFGARPSQGGSASGGSTYTYQWVELKSPSNLTPQRRALHVLTPLPPNQLGQSGGDSGGGGGVLIFGGNLAMNDGPVVRSINGADSWTFMDGCPPGTMLSNTSGQPATCVLCPAGRYHKTTSNSPCTKCPVGLTTSETYAHDLNTSPLDCNACAQDAVATFKYGTCFVVANDSDPSKSRPEWACNRLLGGHGEMCRHPGCGAPAVKPCSARMLRSKPRSRRPWVF